MKFVFCVVLIVLIALFGFFAFNSYIYEEKQGDATLYTLGTYGYRCAEGTEFTISLPEDMASMLLVPATSIERVPQAILTKVESETGARYEGEGIVFHAHGETVDLSTASFETLCIPMSSPDEAPFNFGD